MILSEKRTTVAYRCPFCGGGVMSLVGLFKLSGDMFKLKCPCGESEMTILRRREIDQNGTPVGVVHLSVPCLLCPKPHDLTVREELFFSDDLFTLSCPYSDVNICFTGEVNRVKAELARTELELLDMLEQNGLSDLSALHGEDVPLSDPQVLEVVFFVVRELEEEGRLFCRCPDRLPPADLRERETLQDILDSLDHPPIEDERYQAELTPEGLRVTCTHCGASKLVPTDSLVSAHEFLTVDYLVLE